MRARLLLCTLLATVVACASAAEPPRPLLWKVSDGDNHLYLLGSFHVLKASDYPVSAAVTDAFADAETVAFEISPEEMASPELPKKMLAAGLLPEGQTLQDSMSARDWQRLQDYARKRSVPLQNYQRLEPWFMAMIISLNELSALGFEAAQGLDAHLIEKSAKAGKPTLGLETAEQQIAALDSMTPAEQRQSLSEALDEAYDLKGRLEKLHLAWRQGDEKGLEDLMMSEFRRDYPELYRRVNVARNQAWLPKLRKLLDDQADDDALVVVGSMHLLGVDGLPAQLEARGYKVERL